MARRAPRSAAVVLAALLLLALIGWTWLTFSWSPLQTLDRRLVARPPALASPTGQIASAVALVTWTGVQYVTLLLVAAWANRRRLRSLAVALVLMAALGWGGSGLVKELLHRPRPPAALHLITSSGYSYPSGHMVAATVLAIGVGATLSVTRHSVRARVLWRLGAGLGLVVVGLDRWLLGAHWITDLVGGLLQGAFVAILALILAGVRVEVPHDLVTELARSRAPVDGTDTPPRRAAVIFNPSKVVDWVTFRRHVEYELRTRGWDRTLWLETTVDDPGREMTRQAVEQGVDLVLGAGGDGTIRVICSGLAGTGVPFGLIPSGTGNLLARNIGIPLDRAAALDVAFDGVDKAVDLVQIRIDDGPPDHFAVMAGIGIDAVIMEGTNPDLKKAVGSAAYFLSAAQHANHPALHTTIRVDDRPPLRRRAHVVVVGNVGYLQANIPLIPDAKYDDGRLDVLVASPRTTRDWARLIARVLARQQRPDRQLDRLTGRRVTITVEEREQYQMDGDTAGECRRMDAEVKAGALTLRVPRTTSASREQPSDPLEQSEQEHIEGVRED